MTPTLNKIEKSELINYSAKLRRRLFQMMASAKQGHPGSVLSMVDFVTYLFRSGRLHNFLPEYDRSERDKIIISKGHATMALYPILAELGFFSEDELHAYGMPGSLLKIFGNVEIPGIDATSGSLGHGIGIGAGYCIADRGNGASNNTFVVISEGEMYEGSIWEAALFASHQELENLWVILDRNSKIILGDTEDCVALNPVLEKWHAFGWASMECDGHDFEEIDSAFRALESRAGCPKIIICNTIKGKGIPLMEGKAEWHYWNPLSERDVREIENSLLEEIA